MAGQDSDSAASVQDLEPVLDQPRNIDHPSYGIFTPMVFSLSSLFQEWNDNRLPRANCQGHPYAIFKLIEAL